MANMYIKKKKKGLISVIRKMQGKTKPFFYSTSGTKMNVWQALVRM